MKLSSILSLLACGLVSASCVGGEGEESSSSMGQALAKDTAPAEPPRAGEEGPGGAGGLPAELTRAGDVASEGVASTATEAGGDTCPAFHPEEPDERFCSEACPCSLGQGDCDEHFECAPGLFCGTANGPEFELPAGFDVCTGTCPAFDRNSPGETFCSSLCPCALGQGDCDDHTECAPGLVCGGDNGAEFGLPAGFDVCTDRCPRFDRATPSTTFCSGLCPCPMGQGDCDHHTECAPDLFCGSDNGPEFGLPETWDACTNRCPRFDPAQPSTTFCSELCPCASGQGDCDHHSECAPGLFCGSDNGPEFGLPETWDACTNRCPVLDRKAPSTTFCSALCPCEAGEGDCDSDVECAAGLVCGSKNGPGFGLPETFDVCVAP